jgi:hypothetical protein
MKHMSKAEIESFITEVFHTLDAHNEAAVRGGPDWAAERIHETSRQLCSHMRRLMHQALEVGDKDPDAPLPVITNRTLQ